jgi:DNA repair ATPase RecN
MEAIGKSQALLGSFSREDFDIPKLLDKLEEIPGALAKAQLVTSESTFEALDRFGDFMVSSCIALLGLHLRVRHFQGEIEDRQRQISQLQQTYDNVRVFIQQAGPQDMRQPHALSELQRIQGELSSVQAILPKLTHRHAEVTEQLGREAVKATLGAQVEVGKVTIEIRKEIELPLREDWYLGRLQERKSRLLPKVDEAYKDVDDIFEETEALEASANPTPPADGQGRR